MAEQKVLLSGLELVAKIVIQNERDFSHIKLEEGFDFSKDKEILRTLKAYLRRHNWFYHDPLDLRNSEFHHANFDLGGAILNHVRADNADFYGSTFSGCTITYSQFGNTIFDDVQIIVRKATNYLVSFASCDFNSASFRRAYLQKGQFHGASFQNARFNYAQLTQANFSGADFCNVLGLETTIGLGSAEFEKTKVNERERRIIERAKCKDMFEVMNSGSN
ncbi:MAG TPA: pentapeptide repeat-containing protein [Candidatus Nanoarchaeia archaeon]|nr:pentapeptide repeat-containing protein [Candidatus Nanoarchaeia archaeon]